jgi:hypothetical protein
MGRHKEEFLDQVEQEFYEKKSAWIREKIGNEEADECSVGWDNYSEEYDSIHENEVRKLDEFEDQWSVVGKTNFEIFLENIKAAREILKTPFDISTSKILLVMLYAHVVSSLEAYLSSAFIHAALYNDQTMRSLVESDPEFAKQKFNMNEIYIKKEALKDHLRQYLKSVIFHKIEKIKPMYKSVLNVDFGDADWLFNGVNLRHDCVHRAGYEKNGNRIDLSAEKIEFFINKSTDLVSKVEAGLNELTVDFEDGIPF